MRRLTYRGHNGKGYVCNDGYYNHVSLHLARVAERLTAYEDTGLEPEEIPLVAEMQRQLEAYLSTGTVEHLTELVKAESEGRLVVLPEPRKPLVWGDDDHNSILCPYCENDLMGIPYGDRMLLQCPECGQYLDAAKVITRQEAEMALGGGGDG